MGSDPFAYQESTAVRPATDARAVFGQVMGLVAFTLGFFALGAYIGKDLSGGAGLLFFLLAFGGLFGVNAAARRSEQLAIGLLMGVGLLLGLAMGPTLNAYASADPGAVYQAGGATALFVGGFGAYGYATRRDFSNWGRMLFWALLALIVFGLITLFISIPGSNVIYCVLGLGIFAAYTIFDFNRLKRAGMESAVPIAASIFLDVVNVFLFFLQLFGGGSRR